MLRSVSSLKGSGIEATDGSIGSIADVYIEDQGWTVRYFVVDTGTWLPGRKVLISPMSLRDRQEAGRLFVNLTQDQVRNSPDIDTALPVSRQRELLFAGHYGYPPYWEGPYRWGGSALPGYWAEADLASTRPRVPTAVEREVRARIEQSLDPHLRSANEITGYYVGAKDGEIGHVEELVVDDSDWAVRYMVIDTRNWLPGKKVVIAPTWIHDVSYDESRVYTEMTRETIENAPEFDLATLDRPYEVALHGHYQKRGYWDDTPESWKIFPPTS